MAELPMKQLQREMSSLAETVAGSFGVKLNCAPESIENVENILGMMHEHYCNTQSENGLQGIALEFAAYIVTIIDRFYGPVDWQRDHPTFGRDSFPLYWRGTTLFPMGWCLRRMINGPADDIRDKWRTLVVNHVGNGPGS